MSADHGQEPFCGPEDLLYELDSISAAQQMLNRRTIALQAHYAALAHMIAGERNRADQPNSESERSRLEIDQVNVESAAHRLGYASASMESPLSWLDLARESAKAWEYPRPQRPAERPAVDRRRSR